MSEASLGILPPGRLCAAFLSRQGGGMASPENGDEGGLGVVPMLDEFEGVSRFLRAVVRWAVAKTPGAQACGLTVEQAGRGGTVEYSGEMAARAEGRQDAL